MFSEILEWVKQMIYLLIFLTLLLQVLPKGNYGKYVKFFAGLIFVAAFAGPAVTFLSGQDFEQAVEEQIYEAEGMWEEQEMSGVKSGQPDFEQMERRKMEILTQYAEANSSSRREEE